MDRSALDEGGYGGVGVPGVDEEEDFGGELGNGLGISRCAEDTLDVVIRVEGRA